MLRFFPGLAKFVFILGWFFSAAWLGATENDLATQFVMQQNPIPIDYSTPEVQVAVADIPLYFSPYAQSPLDAQYAHLFFDPLVRWSGKQELDKRLVSQWQVIKPGVIRFHLKENITFHSGNKLSSNDVVWTLSQIRKDAHASEFFSAIQTIKKIDNSRFDIYSSLSETQLLDYLSHFFVLDQRFYEQHKIGANTAQSVIAMADKSLAISGTGPYKIKQYNPLLHLRVVRNENYWGEREAFNGFNFIKIRSADSRLYALLANDVDISEAIAKKDIDTVIFAPSKSLVEVLSSEVIFLTINDKRSDVFKRSVAREAVILSVNKVGMLKHIVNNLGSVRAQFTPLQHLNNEVMDNVIEYDVSRAKYIFSKIEMPAQLTLLVWVDKIGNTPQVANALVNMMKRVGIKLTITEVTDLQNWNALFSNYDFTLSSWQSPLLDRDNIYQDLFTNTSLTYYLRELFEQGQNDALIQTKIALFQQSQKEQRVAPLLFLNKIWATDKKYNLAAIFSINSIPYWHLLTVNEK